MASSAIEGENVSRDEEVQDTKATVATGESQLNSSMTDPAKAARAARQTVIRVKRRIEDSPSQVLLLSCKRSRTEFASADNEPSTSSSSGGRDQLLEESKVLRLVGTVPENEADDSSIARTIRKAVDDEKCNTPRKSIARKSIKAKSSKVTEKARESFKKNTEENRYKVISDRRGLAHDESGTEESDFLKLIDLVPESDSQTVKKKVKPEGFEPGNVTCNGKPMMKEVSPNALEKGFVYDLYLSNDAKIEDFISGEFVSLQAGDEELDFGEYRDNYTEDFMDDDEDSNAEDNWRNDYPDSEEEGLREQEYDYGGGEDNSDDGLYNNFKSMRMKGDSSSDDDVIFGIEDDNDGYSFNSKYSQYKRRVMQEYADEVVSVSSESDLE